MNGVYPLIKGCFPSCAFSAKIKKRGDVPLFFCVYFVFALFSRVCKIPVAVLFASVVSCSEDGKAIFLKQVAVISVAVALILAALNVPAWNFAVASLVMQAVSFALEDPSLFASLIALQALKAQARAKRQMIFFMIFS